MKRIPPHCIGRALSAGLGLFSVAFFSPARADEGMWLLNQPPTRALKERYGFEPSPQWLEHVQKSCVRIGASGSFVSPEGLVMTNHHVGYRAIEKLSTAERNLLETGFYAARHEDELRCPNTDVEVLWTIEDVTDRVEAAAGPGFSPAEALAARKAAMTAIEQEAEEKTKLHCEMVTLYHGARYHLYSYKRYTDVRLVFAPEEKIAFFGGDVDNFEYPRFNLDCCFFRVYENEKPLRPAHYLKWSRRGAADGELTFIAGHPARTRRLLTVDHLKFLRDVELPSILNRYWRRECQLAAFAGRDAEHARIAAGEIRGIANSRKAFTGTLAGLMDPAVMQAKIDAEKKLRAAVDANPEYKAKWADAWDHIATAQRTYRGFYLRHSSLEGRRAVLQSSLLTFARHIVRMAEEKTKPNEKRLREYTDAGLKTLEPDLYSEAPIHDALEIDKLASGLSFFVETFGGDDPLAVAALAGQSPIARAQELVRGTKLKDVEFRKQLVAGGQDAVSTCDDPMIRFAASIDQEARALRKRHEDEVESVEKANYAKVAAAQFATLGDAIAPDATFTLRLSFGPIKGYREGDREIAPFTNFAGLYERFKARQGVAPFDLPPRWLNPERSVRLDTPFNFVCTADIIGGNSGSPVFNQAGEVIGLVFDGNIHGLVWDIAFTEEQGRAVAVDSRAIIEALSSVYNAERLVAELVGDAAGHAAH